MPYFISPLSSQLTAKHKLSWFFSFFFLHTIQAFCLICPFLSVIMPPPPHPLSCVSYLSLFSLTSPFYRICHGNVKNLSCPNSFCALSVGKEGQFCFSWLPSLCCGLKVMKTIFHLHGVIWLGVVEQVCYGKINIMEGLTLLSLSGWDRCVYYWTGYITQTQRHAGNLHTFKARLYTVCKHAQTYGTHKDGTHEEQQGYHVHTVNLCQLYSRPAHTVLYICVHVCSQASTSLDESTKAHRHRYFDCCLIPTDMWLVTLGWKTMRTDYRRERRCISLYLFYSSFFKPQTYQTVATACVMSSYVQLGSPWQKPGEASLCRSGKLAELQYREK